MKGSLTENLIKFIGDLKIKAADLRERATCSLTIGNKQSAESYLEYSKIFNTAANNSREVYLNLKACS